MSLKSKIIASDIFLGGGRSLIYPDQDEGNDVLVIRTVYMGRHHDAHKPSIMYYTSWRFSYFCILQQHNQPTFFSGTVAVAAAAAVVVYD